MRKKADRSAGNGGSREAVIRIRLTPRSSGNEVLGLEDGVFRVKVTAPPVEGKANQALIAFLAKALGISKGKLDMVSGEKSRDKTIRIRGMTRQEVQKALAPVP